MVFTKKMLPDTPTGPREDLSEISSHTEAVHREFAKARHEVEQVPPMEPGEGRTADVINSRRPKLKSGDRAETGIERTQYQIDGSQSQPPMTLNKHGQMVTMEPDEVHPIRTDGPPASTDPQNQGKGQGADIRPFARMPLTNKDR